MSEPAAIPLTESTIDCGTADRLRRAADAAASWEVIPRPEGAGHFQKRVRAAREAMAQLESSLARVSIPHVPSDPLLRTRHSALLELAASQRMIRATISTLFERARDIARLPRLVAGPREDEPRISGLARTYLRAIDGSFRASTLHMFVEAFQSHEVLNVDELWIIDVFLRFSLLEILLAESSALLHSPGSVSAALVMTHIESLRSIDQADWINLIEPLIAFDAILRQDPAGVFGQMDFESRELYRRRIARIARRSDSTECQVAQAALDLAQKARQNPPPDSRMQLRRQHVGYYLVDKGFASLAVRVGFHPCLAWRAREHVRRHGEDYFLSTIQILTLVFVAGVLFPVLPRLNSFYGLAAIVILALIPASQVAVGLVYGAITAFFDPVLLPKLDFGAGIPAACATLVAVPALLLNEGQVRKLVNDLEVRYWANHDPNLHFALLTDLADSVAKPRERDSHPLVELAVRLIGELNAKHRLAGNGVFLLLHRHRIYNTKQGVWMGWERKRGKLLDLNKLLVHEFDAFPIKAGPITVLDHIRYVLTLDSDTEIPRDTAARLVGAIAHPLNQAVIDPKLRLVTDGFGILQPRISVAVQAAARSRLASIYSGQTGVDLYTHAISDAYQNLFGEGIFTGKGIYEVATFHAALDHRFPRDSMLSHDLIEGAYARAGLVSDIELVDDYPSTYGAYMRRKHRWVRGDWQITQWMFPYVPDETGSKVVNPISSISRWKILDNLRRCLVDPALFMLFVAGWIHLPGGPLYWTMTALLMLFLPAMAKWAVSLAQVLSSGRKGQAGEALSWLGEALTVALLRLAFLLHETLFTLDAILRSLIRRFITGERLLEWETAAQSEILTARPADRYLVGTPSVALAVAMLVWRFGARPWAIFCALPILALWALAEPIAIWLNLRPREQCRLEPADRDLLLSHALSIWRYFREFSTERHNHLIPDNVMEEDLREAPRVSPTNIGLLLNARQAACELGFLTIPEFAELTTLTLAAVDRMEKHRGHLFNWYGTETLRPLDGAPFISSVDSGNFVASLLTLHAGTRYLAVKPLLGLELFDGLRAQIRHLRSQMHGSSALPLARVPGPSARLTEWIAWLPDAQAALAAFTTSSPREAQFKWWIRETLQRIRALLDLLERFMPWLLPEFAALRAVSELGYDRSAGELNCLGALQFAEQLQFTLANTHRTHDADAGVAEVFARMLDRLSAAIRNLRNLISDLRNIEREAEHRAREVEFGFLVDPDRRILSIGYEMGPGKRHASCYDLLASEARMATFLAIARGDLPQKSWQKLARDHNYVHGRSVLLSWSGTMFEYLMPALWMRTYPGTMIARAQAACVEVQRTFADELGIPWGVSESGASRKNDRGDYEYFAFGIPRLALWFGATAGPVISPYSTFLALGVDPRQALRNVRRMESAGWVGPYGFYEAADFSVSIRRPVLVKEWMTHHHGMSLLAITNLLRNNIVQRWFHSHPMIQAAGMLLEEKPINEAVLRARLKELVSLRADT